MTPRATARDAARARLSDELTAAIAEDPLGVLPIIAALQRDTEQQLRAAVRAAALTSSWKEIADGLGVSKQAAHQRFKAYAEEVAGELRVEHQSMKRSRRAGDVAEAAAARARRDQLADDLREAARSLKAS